MPGSACRGRVTAVNPLPAGPSLSVTAWCGWTRSRPVVSDVPLVRWWPPPFTVRIPSRPCHPDERAADDERNAQEGSRPAQCTLLAGRLASAGWKRGCAQHGRSRRCTRTLHSRGSRRWHRRRDRDRGRDRDGCCDGGQHRRCRCVCLLALHFDPRESPRIPVHKLEPANTVRIDSDGLNGTVARLRYRHAGQDGTGGVVGYGEVARTVVLVYEPERANRNVLVEREDRAPAEVVLVGLVDESIAVSVVQVVGEDRDISDTDPQVLIKTRICAVRIENNQRIRATIVAGARDMDAGRRVLLAYDRACRQFAEIDCQLRLA